MRQRIFDVGEIPAKDRISGQALLGDDGLQVPVQIVVISATGEEGGDEDQSAEKTECAVHGGLSR